MESKEEGQGSTVPLCRVLRSQAPYMTEHS